ncbi:MAG: guanylate kinase [Bradyrhizobiaceae bacterium]|nr:guanylate kinase [Bradyrhizobiaceae bacterium]
MKRAKKKKPLRTKRAVKRKPAPKPKRKAPARRRPGPKKRRRGLMFVLSSPSGAGKTTLTRMLLDDEKNNVELSISVTTRPKRGSEIEGKHYYFIDRRRFDEMAKRGELLEWAEVHGNGYGTPKAPVEKFLARGKDVLFDIDWQGTLQLYTVARPDVVSVFILPPSAQALRARLARRAEDNQEVIQRRLRNAVDELEHWREYDYVIINDDLDRAFQSLKAILDAERRQRSGRKATGAKARTEAALAESMRRDRQPHLAELVKKLQAEL